MNHINSERLEALLEQFMHENPYGDSRELAEFMYNKGWEARFMYNKGWEDGMSPTCDLF